MLRYPAALSALLVALLLPSAASAAAPSEWTGQVHLVAGQRALDTDFWKPVENQQALGLNVHFGKAHWPLRLLAGGMFSTRTAAAEGYDVIGEVREFSLGVATNLRYDDFIPYVGAGASLLTVVAKGGTGSANTTATDDAFTPGGFVMAGVAYRFGGGFDIGFDLRYLGGTKVELFGAEGNADYLQAGLLFGWSF